MKQDHKEPGSGISASPRLRVSASPCPRVPASSAPAFSLIELLVVIAIMGILAAAALPAISSITQAGGVARGGQILGDLIILARQEAAAKNRDIEVRIIDVADPLWPGYRAVQLWLVDESGANPSPLGKIQKLPEAIVIASNDALSPLLIADTTVSGTTNFGGLGSRPFNGFRVRASGSLPSAITSSNNFLTVQLARDTGVPPANYYTVRVNPVTGRVTIHRP